MSVSYKMRGGGGWGHLALELVGQFLGVQLKEGVVVIKEADEQHVHLRPQAAHEKGTPGLHLTTRQSRAAGEVARMWLGDATEPLARRDHNG